MKMRFSFVHKKNHSAVSNFFKDCEPKCLFPEDSAFTATSSHICLVFDIFQHHKEFFLDLGLVYSASTRKNNNKPPTEEITEVSCQFVSTSLPKRHRQS